MAATADSRIAVSLRGVLKVGRNADLIQGHENEKYRLEMLGKHLTEREGRLRRC